jgi:hypothetical protein
MATDQLTVVSMNARQWKGVSNLIGEHCNHLSNDWQKWGKKIQQLLQSAIETAAKSGSTEKVDVLLNEQNWHTIMEVINKACQSKGKEWIVWSNDICQWIEQSLESSKKESSTKQLGDNYSTDDSAKDSNKSDQTSSSNKKHEEGKRSVRNYYEILGVRQDASQEEIKDRFRFLSQAYHPDKFINSKYKDQAEEDFKTINEAYQTLSDVVKRRKYDEEALGKKNPAKNNNSTCSTDTNVPKQSKAAELYGKGWDSFAKIFGESDEGTVHGHLTRAQGYLTMAYKAAGNDVEAKKGIAGLMALILAHMNDCKNAETWANAEFAINPENVFAKLAWYHIELDKLIGHKGFITQDDGSGFGFVASLLTTGVDVGRVQGKRNAVKSAAIEAAKAIQKKAQTETDPNPETWLLWSILLMNIIENMWTNSMKEPYLCHVILNLPWNRFSNEQIKDLEEFIEGMQVEAHGYLGRLK